jgi:serine/threonine protein kinase
MGDSYVQYGSQLSQNGFTAAMDRPTSSRTEPGLQMQSDDCDGETLAARYQMLEELGSGSFGVVYKAIERATGEIVAVKHVSLPGLH